MSSSKGSTTIVDPDLEDGEIASDEEGGSKSPVGGPQEVPRRSEELPPVREMSEELGGKQRGDHGDRRRRRQRPNQPMGEDEPERKRKKAAAEGEITNEDELLGLCVRGGSPGGSPSVRSRGDSPAPEMGNIPMWKMKATGHIDTPWGDDAEDSKRRRVNSPNSGNKRGGGGGGFRAPSREERDSRARMQMKRKMKPNRKGVADKEVCLNYMKGACTKGAYCNYSHNVCQPRKMELCKFYLKDCCMKRDKCLYLHEEFPCKFFHTGMECYAGPKCKFNHEPLNNMTREILLKHLETAPKDILGDFPRMSRDNAEAMVGNNRFSGPDQNHNRPDEEFPQGRRDDGPPNPRGDEEFNQRGRGESRIENEFTQRRDHDERRNRNQDNTNNRGPIDFSEDVDGFPPNASGGGLGGWREDDPNGNQKNLNHRRNERRDDGDEFGDGPNPFDNTSPGSRKGRENRSPDGPNRFARGEGQNQEVQNRFGRGEGQSPEVQNRFGRGDRQSPDVQNRFGRGPRGREDGDDNGQRRRNDNDDRRRGNDHRGHGNKGDDGFGPQGRNFGPDGLDNRNFNMGPGNRQGRNLDGPGRGFNNDGPSDQRGNFDQNSPRKRNFGPDGPGDGRFGPNDQRGRNFGPNNFGPNLNNMNFGPNNFGPNNFGMNGPNQMNGPNPMFGPNNMPFGPNGPNDFMPDGPNNRVFDNMGGNQGMRGRNGGPGDRMNRRRNEGNQGNPGNDVGDDHRRHEGGPGEPRRDRGPRKVSGGDSADQERPKQTSLSPRQAKSNIPNLGEDESNNSENSSSFDFAKELAEYKNKKIQLDMLKQQEEEEQKRMVIEKGPELIPREERMEPQEMVTATEPAEFSATEFTQNYPAFPTEEEKVKEKKEGSSKRHHHKKKKKHGESHSEDRKSRKERKEKKRQPVIISEDGSFGGIKFKIKLNPGKDEKREVSGHRRPNEFMSSDDEIPLNYLQQKRRSKEDGDDTDTESRLVIETNEEPEDKSSPVSVMREPVYEEPAHYPRHLPRRQQELFMRIQSQQNRSPVPDETSRKSGSPGNRTPTPEPEPADADENWYSSDDEAAAPAPAAPPFAPHYDPRGPSTFQPRPESLNENIPLPPPRSTTPPGPPPTLAVVPKIELAALKDLSKINITQLLSSIRQITGSKTHSAPDVPGQDDAAAQPKAGPSEVDKRDPRARDPRAAPGAGSSSPRDSKPRRPSGDEKPPYAKSIYHVKTVPGSETKQDLDLRFRLDVDERAKEAAVAVPTPGFGDVDLRMLGDGPLPALKLGLPFKPAPMHTAATEIEASLASHPPMDYKVTPIHVSPPDFSSIKISPNDPLVKKDPRLRRLFRVSSSDEVKPEELKNKPAGPVDPRRKGNTSSIADTPKSPPDTPFSPPQEAPMPRLTPNLLSLVVQLGLSAAAGGAACDPRLRSLMPQDLEVLRSAVAGLRPEDLETLRTMEQSQGPQGIPDGPRAPGQGLLPTPPGLGLLPTPSPFMMNNMNNMMPMEAMMGPMGPMGQPMPGPMGPMMNQPMGGPGPGPFGFGCEPPMSDADMRMYRGGYKGERRGGRGNWRGNSRDRNWDNRRQRDNREDRGRNRDHDDRRDRRNKGIDSPGE